MRWRSPFRRRGASRRFTRALYYRSDRWPYRVLKSLPPDRRERAQRRLAYRRQPLLSDTRVRSWPYAELIVQTLDRVIRTAHQRQLGQHALLVSMLEAPGPIVPPAFQATPADALANHIIVFASFHEPITPGTFGAEDHSG